MLAGDAKLVDAICSKAGATHAELKALIKWKSCLPFMLKSAAQAGVRLRKEREGEKKALVAWLRSDKEGPDRKAFEQDKFYLSEEEAKHPITGKYVDRSITSVC